MEFIDPRLSEYSKEHTSPETDLLRRISRDTRATVMMPRMLSGHLQGRFLSMVSKMIAPKNILEIGTYTGYSAICLAEGLKQGGKLITLDINEELEAKVRGYFHEAGLENVVDYRVGNALEIIPNLQENFELVFIDADKENYSKYFDLVIDKVSAGGYLLADNVLWSGKVLSDHPDKDTRAILEFNTKVLADDRVENMLVPIRDGIMMMRRL
jgi:predicted O-methyltransferase YrrM